MKPEQMSPDELIVQLLTTDYGGVALKRTCLIRLLRDPDLGRNALEILEGNPVKSLSNPSRPRDR